MMLGFKGLFIGITDGISQMLLDFFEAYRIYSRRWSLEVVFKESKGRLGLGKYQMRNFSSQIAMTAITAMQYIAECFNIKDEQILDMLVNRSDKLSHFVEIYQLKLAS